MPTLVFAHYNTSFKNMRDLHLVMSASKSSPSFHHPSQIIHSLYDMRA